MFHRIRSPTRVCARRSVVTYLAKEFPFLENLIARAREFSLKITSLKNFNYGPRKRDPRRGTHSRFGRPTGGRLQIGGRSVLPEIRPEKGQSQWHRNSRATISNRNSKRKSWKIYDTINCRASGHFYDVKHNLFNFSGPGTLMATGYRGRERVLCSLYFYFGCFSFSISCSETNVSSKNSLLKCFGREAEITRERAIKDFIIFIYIAFAGHGKSVPVSAVRWVFGAGISVYDWIRGWDWFEWQKRLQVDSLFENAFWLFSKHPINWHRSILKWVGMLILFY